MYVIEKSSAFNSQEFVDAPRKNLAKLLHSSKEDEISELPQKNRFFKAKYNTLIFQNAKKYQQIKVESVVSKVRAFLRILVMMWDSRASQMNYLGR